MSGSALGVLKTLFNYRGVMHVELYVLQSLGSGKYLCRYGLIGDEVFIYDQAEDGGCFDGQQREELEKYLKCRRIRAPTELLDSIRYSGRPLESVLLECLERLAKYTEPGE